MSNYLAKMNIYVKYKMKHICNYSHMYNSSGDGHAAAEASGGTL